MANENEKEYSVWFDSYIGPNNKKKDEHDIEWVFGKETIKNFTRYYLFGMQIAPKNIELAAKVDSSLNIKKTYFQMAVGKFIIYPNKMDFDIRCVLKKDVNHLVKKELSKLCLEGNHKTKKIDSFTTDEDKNEDLLKLLAAITIENILIKENLEYKINIVGSEY